LNQIQTVNLTLYVLTCPDICAFFRCL